jgi:hypothetical protein
VVGQFEIADSLSFSARLGHAPSSKQQKSPAKPKHEGMPRRFYRRGTCRVTWVDGHGHQKCEADWNPLRPLSRTGECPGRRMDA